MKEAKREGESGEESQAECGGYGLPSRRRIVAIQCKCLFFIKSLCQLSDDDGDGDGNSILLQCRVLHCQQQQQEQQQE